MVRPITENDLGLQELYDGTRSTAHPNAPEPVDIVAVHGMGAHPDDTWCSQVPGQDGPTYVNWLKDEQFLPASLPRARIMRYGYSSQWFGENATKTKMSDISQAFLFDLDEFRELWWPRAFEVDTYLRVARRSPMMPRVACFYEQKASEVGRILGRDVGREIQPVILVDETSGSLDLNEKSDKYALPRTHFNIHRFGSPHEQAFRQVRSVIRKMADEGRTLVRARCDEKEKCIQSLCFLNIDARRQDIASAYSGTCDWLFRTAEFRRWHDRTDLPDNRGVLWVKGKPGVGKSTLMKHTLGHCQRDLKKYTIAAYFFNARGADLEKTPCGMLRSLVYQLVTQEPSAFERLLLIFRNKQEMHGATWEWRESELKEFLLSEIQNGQSKPLLLLVDALDECSEPHVRDVVGYLERLSVAAIGTRNLNICLSSRHYPHISMRKCQGLVVEDNWEHAKDIAAYVRGTLIELDGELESALLGKASGVFMWVVLVVAMLNTAYDEGKVEAMHRTLHEVPSDLDDLFQTLLARDKPDKNETVLMLQWILFSARPMTAKELFYATLAGTNAESLGTPDPSVITPDHIRRRITNSSRGLIEVRKDQAETVQFIHETVNDFLLRNRRLQTLDPALQLNPIRTSHGRLNTCCISYVTRAARQTPDVTVHKRTITSRYPFMEYAANCFLNHAEAAEAAHVGQAEALWQLTENHDAMELIAACGNSVELSVWRCSRTVGLLYAMASGGHRRLAKALLERGGDVSCQHESCGKPLQAAVYAGNAEIVALLLENGADVNASGGYFGTPLHAAAFSKNTEIAALLLKNGANVNASGWGFGTPLQAAARVGNAEIVALLLENGADVNAQSGFFGTPLHAAAFSKNTEIAALLLKNGADVNASGWDFATPLQAAAYARNMEIVALLLEKGADVNAQGGFFGTALQAAEPDVWNAGIAALLLKKGARR
ncbi:hypothetical protein RB599_005843 [Gaeumannomyces hyphopodioides]